MNCPHRHTRSWAGVALMALALAGCAVGGGTPSRSSAVREAACRQRADEVYDRQNRADVYRTDNFVSSTRDAPFGGSGLRGSISDGLPGQYARDQILSDCLNGTGSGGGGPGADPLAPNAGGPPPPPPIVKP
jgi:hypothetical protein